MLDLDQQLAQLLGTMNLQGVWNAKANMVSRRSALYTTIFRQTDIVNIVR
jgi:hypothetical protein